MCIFILKQSQTLNHQLKKRINKINHFKKLEPIKGKKGIRAEFSELRSNPKYELG